jgi:hypothetical protein
MGPIAVAVSTLLAAGWVDAGAFKLKLEVKQHKLWAEVDAETPVHFRLADAAMVQLEAEHLTHARSRAASLRELLDDPGHQDGYCHASILEQLAAAERRPAALASEDVFTRVLARPHTPVAVELWAAAARLDVIVIDGKRLQLPEPVELPAPFDWVAVDGDEDLSFRGDTVYRREDIGGLGCFGMEGIFSLPGEWLPIARDAVVTHTVAEGAVARLHRHNVVINDHLVTKLKLSSPKPDTFYWLDDQRVGDRYVVVFTAEGPSRPEAPASRCGGGTERDAVWLLLKPDFTVEKEQVVNLESCWTSKEGTLHYDRRHPLDGLEVR